MSALRIIVGGWLVLNAVVFAALMLRRGRPALRDRLFRWMVDDEVHDRLGDLAAIDACLRERSRDLVSHVEGPALGDVESDDADRRRTLALAIEQVADQPRAVGADHVGFGSGQTELAGEVIEHESSRLANPTDSPS